MADSFTNAELVRSILLSTSLLTAALVIATVLTVSRSPASSVASHRLAFVRWLLLGIGLQCLHAGEEFATGFHAQLPQRLGLTAWPAEFFVVFNLCWIGIWLVSAVGVVRNVRVAYVPTWFLAIAMTMNGVVHPLLALQAGAYFPGLYTAPLTAVVGVVLLVKLWRLTSPA